MSIHYLKTRVLPRFIHAISLLIALYLIIQTLRYEMTDGDWIIIGIPYFVLALCELGWFWKPRLFKVPIVLIWLIILTYAALGDSFLINLNSAIALVMLSGILFL